MQRVRTSSSCSVSRTKRAVPLDRKSRLNQRNRQTGRHNLNVSGALVSLQACTVAAVIYVGEGFEGGGVKDKARAAQERRESSTFVVMGEDCARYAVLDSVIRQWFPRNAWSHVNESLANAIHKL